MDNDLDNETKPDQVDLNRPAVGGRPPKYETSDELEEAISGYFNGGMKMRRITTGTGKDKKTELIPIITITGLVLYLGYADRASFYDLEKDPKFSHTIKRARTFIENEYEEILALTGNAGAIFALKNFGWHDKQEIEMSAGQQSTEDKLKEFLDERNDNAYDQRSEHTAAIEAGGDSDLAQGTSDIS